VAFTGDTTGEENAPAHVFVRDVRRKSTEKVSAGHFYGASPSLSPGGRYVAFLSYPINDAAPGGGITQVFVYDRTTRHTQQLTANGSWPMERPLISADTRHVALGQGFGDDEGAEYFFKPRVWDARSDK
jgi:Tol biopolymer transport system component